MAKPDSRIPANQVALLFAVLLGIWVVWLVLPKSEKPPVVSPPLVVESRFHAAGLPDNPDWDGLAEFFAAWAGQVPWRDDKVQFAYWNPGAHTYSYFFEAAQGEGKVRFRVLSRAEALQRKEFIEDDTGWFFPSETDLPATRMAAVDFGADSPTHPFVFFQAMEPPRILSPQWNPARPRSDPGPPPAPAKLPPFPLPPIELKPPPLPHDSPKK